MHKFMPLELFLVFLQYRGAFKARVCASETISYLVATNMLNPQLGLKLMFTILLDTSMHFLHSF